MKLKTLLTMSALALTALTTAIGCIVFSATIKADDAVERGTRAEKLITEVFELNGLTQDYLAHKEERPKAQWYLHYANLNKGLDALALNDEPAKILVRSLRAEMEDIARTFEELTAREATATMYPALEKQFADDLHVKLRRSISGIEALANDAFQERISTRERTDRLTFALLFLLVIMTLANAAVLYGRIALPIVNLQKGAEIIGQGDLTHKVGGDADDEIGRLARAFDDMTAKLKRSHDILEEKVRERTKELEDLSVQNETMLESVGDGLVAIDKEWNITLWNPAAAEIAGWSKEEALGRPLRKIVRFVRRTDRSENVLFISDAMIDGKVHFMEDGTVLVRKDGTECDVSDSAAPILGRDGSVRGAIIAFRDTSKEKELERSKNDIVSLVTHELRGPATIVRTYAELLKKKGAVKKEQQAFVQGIYDASERLIELANSLLTVFRIDFGEVVIDPEPVDITALGDDAVAQQDIMAATKDMKIEKAYDDAIPVLNVDKKLVDLVFANLLSNAVKYTPKGGKVRLEIRKRSKEVRIIVADDGLGIPKDQQAKIFGKFFRASNVKAVNGVGIGLHVLKAMIERAGCTMGFESEENGGSTFYVAIPMSGMTKVGTRQG